MQEFQAEGLPLLLNHETLDRMIMARLLDAPEQYPEWPVAYLIGCYARASTEIRALGTLKDKAAADGLQLDLQYCKDLIVANAGLLLTLEEGPFPQVHFAADKPAADAFRRSSSNLKRQVTSSICLLWDVSPASHATMCILLAPYHQHFVLHAFQLAQQCGEWKLLNVRRKITCMAWTVV